MTCMFGSQDLTMFEIAVYMCVIRKILSDYLAIGKCAVS